MGRKKEAREFRNGEAEKMKDTRICGERERNPCSNRIHRRPISLQQQLHSDPLQFPIRSIASNRQITRSENLVSLSTILAEYITLKEHKVLVDEERNRVEQEKLRVQNLLSGMQDVMNAYNVTGSYGVTPPPPLQPPTAPVAMASSADLAVGRPAGFYKLLLRIWN